MEQAMDFLAPVPHRRPDAGLVGRGFPALRDAVRDLTTHKRVHPRHLREHSFLAELLADGSWGRVVGRAQLV
ncbi:hypothetical protein Sros01_80070 [Streptomyces roseochromogenus]|nr:hypothetical protein Sros01_80070 [Streptomyces roseochromogenus]